MSTWWRITSCRTTGFRSSTWDVCFLVTRRSLDAIDRGVELLKLRLGAFDHSVEVCAELCVDHVVRRFERCPRTGARSNEDDQHASLLHQFSDGHTHAAPFDPTADITNQKS